MGGGECLESDLGPEDANQCNVYLWGYTCYVSCNPSQYTTINSTAAIVKHKQRWVRMSVTREGEGERRECWAKYRQQWVESSQAEDRAQELRGAAASPSFLLQSVARCGPGRSETLHLSVNTDTTHHTPSICGDQERLSICFSFWSIFGQNTYLYLLESSFHEWKCSNNTCLEHSRFSLGKIVTVIVTSDFLGRSVQVQSKLKSSRNFIESQLSSSQLLLTY